MFKRLLEQCAAFADPLTRHPCNEFVTLLRAGQEYTPQPIPFVGCGFAVTEEGGAEPGADLSRASNFPAVAGGRTSDGLGLIEQDFERHVRAPLTGIRDMRIFIR